MCSSDLFGVYLVEHHFTGRGQLSSSLNMLAHLAARTSTIRLGAAVVVVPWHNPLMIAEQAGVIDVLSNGRLDLGLGRGYRDYEFSGFGIDIDTAQARLEEAVAVIRRAWQDEERFSFDGEFWHFNNVTIEPRPVQQPHPPLWSTTGSKTQAKLLGEKGYVMATLGSGYATRPLQDAYRQGYFAKRGTHAPADRFGYLGLVAVGNNEAEARRRGDMVATYLSSSAIVHVPFRNPPGFLATEEYARMLRGESPPRSYTRDGRPIDMYRASVQDLIDAGILFCGTPDQVTQQITDFCDYCGGMGNLLMMGHAGAMPHDDTVGNLTLFAKEVMPALKAYKQPVTEIAAA